MEAYQGYLIDLDGTLYNGRARIPSAERFVKELLDRQLPFLFVTNNATRTPEEVADFVRSLTKLPIEKSHIYTSALALIDYLKEHYPRQTVHIVGEPSLHQLIAESGFTIDQTHRAQVVVQALDQTIDYHKLTLASQAILNGAKYLITNYDRAIPTEKGKIPSSGAISAFIEHTTNKKGTVMGKPFSPIIHGALKVLNLPKESLLMIGDNYETDIKAGIDHGIDTLLVLTGVTQVNDLIHVSKKPTYVLDDLSQWRV